MGAGLCRLASVLDDGLVPAGFFLEVYLFGGDMLASATVGIVVGLVLGVFGSILGGLGEVVVGVEVYLTFGVGVVVEGLVDGAFERILLLAFEEVEHRLIITSSVPIQVGFGGRSAHLTI